MNWKREIEELKKREKLAEEMGGKEKLKRQKDNNRLNIRERIKTITNKRTEPYMPYTNLKGRIDDIRWFSVLF